MSAIKGKTNNKLEKNSEVKSCSANRVLGFYTTIKLGGRIYKSEYMELYGISHKTLSRDKGKVENYLSEYYKITIELYYDRCGDYYELPVY